MLHQIEMHIIIRVTLDEGPRTDEIEQIYYMRAINWTHGL